MRAVTGGKAVGRWRHKYKIRKKILENPLHVLLSRFLLICFTWSVKLKIHMESWHNLVFIVFKMIFRLLFSHQCMSVLRELVYCGIFRHSTWVWTKVVIFTFKIAVKRFQVWERQIKVIMKKKRRNNCESPEI